MDKRMWKDKFRNNFGHIIFNKYTRNFNQYNCINKRFMQSKKNKVIKVEVYLFPCALTTHHDFRYINVCVANTSITDQDTKIRRIHLLELEPFK